MEEVIQKLSEIESTAKKIMEDAQLQKATLDKNLQQRMKEYDEQSEKQLADELMKRQKALESKTKEQIAALEQKTSNILSELDQYYEKNHERLVQEIFDHITEI